MDINPLYLLLAKLEDEINYQRKVVNTLLFADYRLTEELLLKSLEILKRTIQTFRLVSFVLDQTEAVSDRSAKEQALLMGSECLSLASILLPALEQVSPIFIDSIRINEESLLERIESVAEDMESYLQVSEGMSVDEITKGIEEILQTLEYHIRVGERAIGKIL